MQPKTSVNISCSILAYLVSAEVNLLDVNATDLFLPWLSFCMSTASSPTFDASIVLSLVLLCQGAVGSITADCFSVPEILSHSYLSIEKEHPSS